MNIAIDVLAILGEGSKNRGIGNYTTSQLKKMFELDKKNNYYLINFYEDISLKKLLDYSDNVKELYFYTTGIAQIRSEENFKGVLKDITRKIIHDYKIDVFYVTSPFDGAMFYEQSWFEGITSIVTLYDIIPYLFRERYLVDQSSKNEYMKCIEELTKYDRILSISQSAKDDLVGHFNVNPDKIDVIYAGVDERYKVLPQQELEEARKEFVQLYGITSDFIMCTGGDDERKNIGGLIEAYSCLPPNLISQYQLVIACKLSSVSEKRYYELAEKKKVKGRVILTNFVPDQHLIQLYNLATAVAFPSKYEGFGLPVIEGMACETPVLTSNNSSLGEIAEGAAILVDPFNLMDITRGLLELLENANRQELIKNGSERVKRFSWQAVSGKTIEIIGSTLSKPINNSSTMKKRLAFFTPLPPLQSGISDYSYDLLNELSSDFDISVFIDGTYQAVEFDQSKQISVLHHQEFLRLSESFDEIIYQMGNSEYHIYMINYIKRYKGILVLHDYNLHLLFNFISSQEKSLSLYADMMMEDYDSSFVKMYLDDVKHGRSTRKIYELPLNGYVSNYAKKIIVHSDYAKRQLLEKNFNYQVKKIQSLVIHTPIRDKAVAKEKLGIKSDQVIIAAFGHIHETKRSIPLIQAFQQLAKEHYNVHLYLVGKLTQELEKPIKALLKESSLKQRVKITGYTNSEDYEKYIEASDICVNLRFPYNGETSGSLMRILSKGKCSIVSALGSFDEIPDDCCVKIESAEKLGPIKEVEAITEKLNLLLSHPEMIQDIERNARKYSEQYLDIQKVANEYKDFIGNNYRSNLTEKTIKSIYDHINRNQWTQGVDFYKLTKTIAYSKSY
ncbi:glycosyltransferase [Paenibacillus herberti]|uniref:Glycosyl transferase family 1 n=1 Tax=Paenibacillus herberti TaxID=1619309 RepID=A0A229NWS5_9BACL|nr:glycosyltransferase [Paenibacillus herberti]OXM14215.1 hypothetical protein CGZ75_14730 [Paenibacillus herberti]